MLGVMSIKSVDAADAATVWFGTRGDSSKGIYRATLDLESGRLSAAELAAEIRNPGFLTLSRNERLLYSLGRPGEDANVAVYEVGEDGGLSLLDTANSGGGGATHLSLSSDERTLLMAHYGGGSVASLALSENGQVDSVTSLIAHSGASVNRQRQSSPHPHWIGPSPDGQFVLVPDLGTDEVVIYRLDSDTRSLTRHGAASVPPGAGPRHLKFHPNGRWVYVINELGLTVTCFHFDSKQGVMERFQTEPAIHPTELKEVATSGSEIRVHPSGKFVYAGIRGHDVIAVFQIDANSGRISRVELEPIRGTWPRNFGIDPTGRWLLAAGAESSTVAVFRIDAQSGKLVFTRNLINVPGPICVEFSGVQE